MSYLFRRIDHYRIKTNIVDYHKELCKGHTQVTTYQAELDPATAQAEFDMKTLSTNKNCLVHKTFSSGSRNNAQKVRVV